MALGKGISSILDEVESSYASDLLDENSIQDINISDITENPYQPRTYFDEENIKELSASILSHGLIQPVIVMKDTLHSYTLIAGERRLRATKLLGKRTIKAIISDLNPSKIREIAIIENIQRVDLNAIELAKSYSNLMDEYKITQEELSVTLKKSRSQITNTLRLLKLTLFTQENIANGKLSQGHAKVLIGLDDKVENNIVSSILGQKLNVRETEKLVKQLKNNTITSDISSKDNKNNDELLELLKLLESHSIQVKLSKNKLNISIDDLSSIKTLIRLFTVS